MFLRNLAVVAAATAVACGDDGDGSSGSASGSTGAATASGGSSGGDGSTGGSSTAAPTTGATDGGGSGGASNSDGTSSGGGEASSGGTTAAGPTDGPGVLPGETGLDAFCRRYVECGGTFYADKQACMDASLNYWGECASRRMALDAFGACMSEMECTDWSPDLYSPSDTPCAQQWDDLSQSRPCP